MFGQFFSVKNQPSHIDTLTNVYFCYNLGAHEKEFKWQILMKHIDWKWACSFLVKHVTWTHASTF